MIEPVSAYKPYMACIGNHETGRFDFHGVPFSQRFRMPGNAKGFYYWFDYSSIHFVVLSSEHDYAKGSKQYRWLEQHLLEFDRLRNRQKEQTCEHGRKATKKPISDEVEEDDQYDEVWWVVVLIHRSMYSSSLKEGSVIELRNQLEPLFNKHSVDLVISGHDHN